MQTNDVKVCFVFILLLDAEVQMHKKEGDFRAVQLPSLQQQKGETT